MIPFPFQSGGFGRVQGSSAAPSSSYLDGLASTPVVAWSLTNKLISTATQCIRVRRSSDNTEQDIGFSGNYLDTTALLAFVGAGNGFIRTVYDQVGSNHQVQATTANQPRIVNAGVYDDRMVFDGSNDGLTSTSTLTMGTPLAFVFMEMVQTTSATVKMLLEMSSDYGAGVGRFAIYDYSVQGGIVASMGASGATRANSFVNAGGMAFWTFRFDRSLLGPGEVAAWRDGASMTSSAVGGSTTDQTGNFAAANNNIGARNGGASLPSTSGQRQVVIYTADVSALRTSIETILGA